MDVHQPTELFTSTLFSDSTTCNGYSDGAAEVTGINGTPGYTYSWTNGQTGPILSNVIAGQYSCFITDANGCQKIEDVIIEQPDVVNGIIEQDSVSCFSGLDGGLNLTPSGGTSPYTYNWNNGSTNQNLTNVVLVHIFVQLLILKIVLLLL